MSGSDRILLDSNIIIYLSQGKLFIDDVFASNGDYAISLITYMEILSYRFTSREEEDFIHQLLSLFTVIDIDKEIAEAVIRLRKRRKIKLPDAVIVATAQVYNLILYTNDKQLHGIESLTTKFFD